MHRSHQLSNLKEAQMRKHAPALIVTTIFALASGSAFALGDRGKEKKANADAATTTQSTPSSSSSYTPANPGAPSQSMKTENTGSPSGTTASSGSMGAAADASDKRKQVASNDPRCDESKYARSAMPKDCFEKSGTGAAATGSTQGQSGK
jgi:hypothetical protein